MATATEAALGYHWNGSSWDIVSLSPVPDAVTNEAISNLTVFNNWLSANSVKGVVGEIGWANNHNFSGDATLWNTMAHVVLSYLDTLGLDFLIWAGDNSWVSSGGVPTYVLAIYYTDSTAGDNIMYNGTQATVASHHYPLGTYRRGVNAADANAHAEPQVDGVATTVHPSGYFNSSNPGILGTDYWYPSDSDFAYYATQGVEMVCVRFRWERLQPTLGGSLSSTELTAMEAMLTSANNHGVKVCIEPHNGKGYILGTSPTAYQTYPISQAGTVTASNFVNLWTEISTALSGYPALAAYGLINEPSFPSCGIPSGSNMLTNGSFATNITGWSASNAGSTVAWASTPVFSGSTGSLAITATSSASSSAVPGASTGYVYAVTAGTAYQIEAWFLAGSSSLRANCKVQLNWHDASGDYLGASSDVSVYDSSTQWQYTSLAATAPTNAAYAEAIVFFESYTNGEVHYVDNVILRQCTSPMDSVQLWQLMTQQVVTALRAQSDNTEVWIEGAVDTAPQFIPVYHPTPWITDSANATRYDAHMYFDYADGGGGAYTDSYATELSTAQSAGY